MLFDDEGRDRLRLGLSETLRGGRTDENGVGAGARMGIWMGGWLTLLCRTGGVDILRVFRGDT